jgi:hypothetical protein
MKGLRPGSQIPCEILRQKTMKNKLRPMLMNMFASLAMANLLAFPRSLSLANGTDTTESTARITANHITYFSFPGYSRKLIIGVANNIKRIDNKSVESRIED